MASNNEKLRCRQTLREVLRPTSNASQPCLVVCRLFVFVKWRQSRHSSSPLVLVLQKSMYTGEGKQSKANLDTYRWLLVVGNVQRCCYRCLVLENYVHTTHHAINTFAATEL